MSYQTAVEIKDAAKTIGDRKVVDGLSLEVRRGECFGLLGREDAGKTTTLRLLCGSAVIEQGEIFVLGLNARQQIREIKSRMGVVLREDGLDPDFSALENLLVFASYHEIPAGRALPRAQELLKWLHLEEFSDASVESLSKGARKRLAIARALLNEPELLILDEPTADLDSQSRYWIWDFLRDMKKQKSSLIIGTDQAREAEKLCDRVAILDQGRVLAVGKPAQLIQQHIGDEVVEFKTLSRDLNYYLGRLKAGGFSYQVFAHTGFVFIKPGQSSKQAMELVEGNQMTLRRPTLDDVFLTISGRLLREEE
jgi:lipooligosaccharide transport system ATP-binding protein